MQCIKSTKRPNKHKKSKNDQLSGKSHNHSLMVTCHTTNSMNCLANIHYGADWTTLPTIYRSLILSYLDYESIAASDLTEHFNII